MIDIEKIQEEIDVVKNTIVSNSDELESLKKRYLSKDGILPEIYKTISNIKGSKSDYYLSKMLELRHSIDDKIKTFIQSH